MSDFEGGGPVEPMIGEIRVLRSFALADDGSLLPITEAGGGQAWVDGENVATCTHGGQHEAPAEGCTCGFYAYGDAAWIDPDTYGWFHHVVAVIECYGKVVAGEKGIKAGRARIVAVWLSDEVPLLISGKARRKYPGVTFFSDCTDMDARFPPTPLDTYRKRPNKAMRGLRSVMGWAPLVGAVAGVGIGMGGSWIWLALSLIPALWAAYLPVRWGLAHPHQALRTLELMALIFFTSTALVRTVVSPGSRESALMIALSFIMGMSAAFALSRRRIAHLTERHFTPIVRSGPLERLVGNGITSLETDGAPFAHGGAWVQLLSSPQGKVALIQSVSDTIEPVEMVAYCERMLRERGVQGVLIVPSEPLVYVADRVNNAYVIGVSLPLGETFAALGVPPRLWCPFPLRAAYISSVLGGISPTIAQSGVVPVYEVFPEDEMPMYFSPEASEAYAHAQAMSGRLWYRDCQSEIAQSGLEPAARPGLPMPAPSVTPARIAAGWQRLLGLPWPDAVQVQHLYFSALRELPEEALLINVFESVERDFGSARSLLRDDDWMPSQTLAGHLIAARLSGADQIECFARDGMFALVTPVGLSRMHRVTFWSLDGPTATPPE